MPKRNPVLPTLLLALLPLTVAAQGSDIVRGRVVDAKHHPLDSAEVTVTGTPGAIVQVTKTNARGEYTVVFRDPQDSYTIAVRRVGYTAFTTIARRRGLSTVVEVEDIALSARMDVLQPVRVRVTKFVPRRGEVPAVGSTELNAAGNAQFTADPSDLRALMGLLPGTTPRADSGVSFLGAPPDQNKILVDGMDFGGGALPRDAIGTARVVTSTFDPARGQFAGGALVITTRPGLDRFASTVRAELIHPSLSWADPASLAPVPRIGALSGFLTGAIRPGVFRYMIAFDASRRTAAAPSLLAPDAAHLSQLGVSLDTVARVAQVLTGLGAPLTASGIPGTTSLTRGSASLRADYELSATTSFTASVIGNWTQLAGAGISRLGFPTAAAESRSSFMQIQLTGGTYVHDVLEELHVSFSPSASHAAPYASLPGGIVRVGATYPDGRRGLEVLRFGGSGAGESRARHGRFDIGNEISWAPLGARHQFKLTQAVQAEWGRLLQTPDPAGAYTYRSVAELAANRPASYTRTLSAVERSIGATTLALSAGDLWRAIPGKLEFQGGVRLDATRFSIRPAYNARLDSLFGLRTDRAPRDIGLSPRLGFSWSPRARRRSESMVPPQMMIPGSRSVRGTLAPLDASGIAVPRGREDLTLTGGVGAFRGIISSARVAALADATGLAAASRSLECVGDAVPIPDWSSTRAMTPAVCDDGAAASGFASTTPAVTVFDSRFRAPVSWRGDLQLTGLRLGGWAIAPRLTYSIGAGAEGRIDANLRRTPGFRLAGESGRPVFADASSIVPASGLFAPAASRVAGDLGRVTRVLSDLSYRAGQLTVALAPPRRVLDVVPLYLVYAGSMQRARVRGFDGSTAGDPFAAEWAAGRQPAHQIIVGMNNLKLGWFVVGARLNLLSGTPFTPMVAQDVNGDGLANDRAFIPGPSGSDTALANALSRLRSGSPAGVRRCLDAQAGRLAGANSCRTPWRAQVDLALGLVPTQRFRLGDRLQMTAALLNAGGALMRLFRLENTALGQASARAPVDQRLLYVTGFDPVARRFSYEVNQVFGQPLDFGAARHRAPPFQLRIGLQYRMGYPPVRPLARRVGSAAQPQGAADTAAANERVRERLIGTFLGPDPIQPILRLRDSLALLPDQAAGIEAVERALRAQTDSLLAPVVAFVRARGAAMTDAELRARIQAVQQEIRRRREQARQRALSFLHAGQRDRLAELLRHG